MNTIINDDLKTLIKNNSNINNNKPVILQEVKNKRFFSFFDARDKLKDFFCNKLNKNQTPEEYSLSIEFILSFIVVSSFLSSVFLKNLLFLLIPIFPIVFFIFMTLEKKKTYKILRQKIINNIDYILPLTSSQIIEKIGNNENLKNIIISKIVNENLIITEYLIDVILNKNNFSEKENLVYEYFSDNKCGFDDKRVLHSFYEEQMKIVDIQVGQLLEFEVKYQIENGPVLIKNILHNCRDENLFLEYLNGESETLYGRNINIISINRSYPK